MTDRAEYKKQWYQDNKERLLQKQKDYNKINNDQILGYQDEYRENNKIKISLSRKIHYQKNKDKIVAKQNERSKFRRATDPIYKLRKNCSCMIWKSLKQNKKWVNFKLSTIFDRRTQGSFRVKVQ